MKSIWHCLLFACLAVIAALHVGPAQAQATRTFVVAQGSDGNPCTFALPCRTFQHAHDVVASGGEIDVLDPAGYGALTITKAISIQGHGYAGITVSPFATGITINAGAQDDVSLRGLLIDGAVNGGVGGGYGVQLNTAQSLKIQECVLRNFINAGVYAPPASASMTLTILNSVIVGNNNYQNYGIAIGGGAGGGTAVLDHVTIEGTNSYGITASSMTLTVTDSRILNTLAVQLSSVNAYVADTTVAFGRDQTGGALAATNGSLVLYRAAIYRNADGGVSLNGRTALIANSAVASNGASGVVAFNSGTLRLTRSVITGNVDGWAAGSGGVVSSYADNEIDGNTNSNNSPPVIGHK